MNLITDDAIKFNKEDIINILKSPGIWNLIILLISLFTLFIVWNIRDQNATKQIENQRKDINLKEFQKIAEWVSGAHLIEDEITDKLTNSKKEDTLPTEKTIKYTQPNSQQSIPTFSKRDGAVGLQIAAIYNLLPFFQGKHGEDFRKPALNLLTSAWLALQQQEVLKLEQMDINEKEFEDQIDFIHQRAKSPIGIALTEVLLSDGGNNLLKFKEVFPNLNLAGMDFHLPGLDKNVLSLFKRVKNCQGINLIGTNLPNANLSEAELLDAKLQGANLLNADLSKTKLQGAKLQKINLRNAILQKANLSGSIIQKAYLYKVNLTDSILTATTIEDVDLRESNFKRTNLYYTTLRGTQLQYSKNLLDNDLNNTYFDGSVVNYDPKNIDILNIIKFNKGIILHINQKSISGSKFSMKCKSQSKIFTQWIFSDINIEKTRQENPDWEIYMNNTIEE